MEITRPDAFLVRAGFVLFTLAAHLTGIMNALVLMALGLAWGLLTFGPMQAQFTRGAFLCGTCANWIASCLAAAWGTSRLTPLSGAGYGAAPWKETVLAVHALRSKPAAT